MPNKKEDEYYEVMPSGHYKETEDRSAELEREIDEIKAAIKGSAGVASLGESAEKFMSRILELITNSQKMVSEVAQGNRVLAEKVQVALDTMNKSNSLLSERLTKILDYFTEAAELESGEAESIEQAFAKEVEGLRTGFQTLIEQNKKSQQLLMMIEKNLRTGGAQRPAPIPRQQPMQRAPMPQRTLDEPVLKPGELPPPPFPP